MKELSIEEKAKRYDNIIEKANKMHHENCEACQMCIEELIPGLAESEDEKTKRMLDIITYKMSQHQPDIFTGEENEWFNAWLEKQKEQNHWQPCIGELVELGNVIEYIESGKSCYKGGISYLKTLKENLYKL